MTIIESVLMLSIVPPGKVTIKVGLTFSTWIFKHNPLFLVVVKKMQVTERDACNSSSYYDGRITDTMTCIEPENTEGHTCLVS